MRYLRWLIVIVAPVLAVLADRFTKQIFVDQPTTIVTVIPDWLWFQLHINNAMAFSVPLMPWLYYPAIALALVGLGWAGVRAVQQSKYIEITCVLTIIAAAFSNLIDRVWFGGVVDFIAIPTGGVFNLADVAIIVSVLVWAVQLRNTK